MVNAKTPETKSLFFDAGPIISLVMSRLSWTLPRLKEKFGGKFYITPAVKYELIERPINIRRFGFEALQVLKLIREGVFEVYENIPQQTVKELKELANTSFRANGSHIDILQEGELESLSSALVENAPIVMDERTLRLFIENSSEMKKLLRRRFRTKVTSNQNQINLFLQQVRGVTIIRSIELVSVAYKLGLLNPYLPQREHGKETLVNSVLWATKYNGCAVTPHEIEEIKMVLMSKTGSVKKFK